MAQRGAPGPLGVQDASVGRDFIMCPEHLCQKFHMGGVAEDCQLHTQGEKEQFAKNNFHIFHIFYEKVCYKVTI